MNKEEKLAFLSAFREKAREVLRTQPERQFLQQVLRDFSHTKNLQQCMASLESVLLTPEHHDLLRYIRALIPVANGVRAEFDRLAPYHLMRTPLQKGELERSCIFRNQRIHPEGKPSLPPVRDVFVQRDRGQSLGISIRGGQELGLGLFVVSVDDGSLGQLAGLEEGDHILSVNSIFLGDLPHDRACNILDACAVMQLKVQATKRIPVAQVQRVSVSWVDSRTGKVISEMDLKQREAEAMKVRRTTLQRSRGALGFSVRGGSEQSLPIFIAAVEERSQAQASGLRPGDQILAINGHDISRVTHSECVSRIQASNTLELTLRSTAVLPQRECETVDFKWQDVQSRRGTPPLRRRNSMFARRPRSGLQDGPRQRRPPSLQLDDVVLPPSLQPDFDPTMSPLDVVEAKLKNTFEFEHIDPILNALTNYIRGTAGFDAILDVTLVRLTTPVKASILHEIRKCIKLVDLPEFDFRVKEWEIEVEGGVVTTSAPPMSGISVFAPADSSKGLVSRIEDFHLQSNTTFAIS